MLQVIGHLQRFDAVERRPNSYQDMCTVKVVMRNRCLLPFVRHAVVSQSSLGRYTVVAQSSRSRHSTVALSFNAVDAVL